MADSQTDISRGNRHNTRHGSLLFFLLGGKPDEDLLQRGLAHRVFLNARFFARVFDDSEHVAKGAIGGGRDAVLDVGTLVLYQLGVGEGAVHPGREHVQLIVLDTDVELVA